MIKLRKILRGFVFIIAIVAIVVLFYSALRHTAQLYLDGTMGALDYLLAAQCIVLLIIAGMFLGG